MGKLNDDGGNATVTGIGGCNELEAAETGLGGIGGFIIWRLIASVIMPK